MRVFIIVITFILSALTVNGQAKAKIISLKKGEVLDVIFINNKPGNEEARKQYFTDVYPPANAGGYTGLPGFGIPAVPTEGNYWPDVMALGRWKSLSARHHTMKALIEQFPDFHERRRLIWPTFNMTYYEMTSDISFTTDPDKFYVIDLYWREDVEAFGEYLRKRNKASEKAGGQRVLELINGQSPYGYYFNPDYFSLTEWSSRSAFEAFKATYENVEPKGVRHLNQFGVL